MPGKKSKKSKKIPVLKNSAKIAGEASKDPQEDSLLQAAQTAKNNADLESKLKRILNLDDSSDIPLEQAKKKAIQFLILDMRNKVEEIKALLPDLNIQVVSSDVNLAEVDKNTKLSDLTIKKNEYDKLNILVRATGYRDSTARLEEYQDAESKYLKAKEVFEKQTSILNLAKQQHEIYLEARAIVEKALVILSDPDKQDYDELMKQRAIIDVAYDRAKSESAIKAPTEPQAANTGYVERRTDSKAITRVRHGVTDRALEAKNVTRMLNPNLTPSTNVVSVNRVEANAVSTAYHHLHIEKDSGTIIQTYEDLGHGNVLYIETDHTDKVTSRSTYGADQAQDSVINAAREVAYQQAMMVLDKLLPAGSSTKGKVEFQIDARELGEQGGMSREAQVNILYAALLDLSKGNIKITTRGIANCGPAEGMFYGHNNEAFIKKYLGDNVSERKAKQKQFMDETKALRATMQDNKGVSLEGSTTETKKPGMQ